MDKSIIKELNMRYPYVQVRGRDMDPVHDEVKIKQNVNIHPKFQIRIVDGGLTAVSLYPKQAFGWYIKGEIQGREVVNEVDDMRELVEYLDQYFEVDENNKQRI